MDYVSEDEMLRRALEESLRTATEEQQRHPTDSHSNDYTAVRSNSGAPSAPTLPPLSEQASDSACGVLSWEQQRLEALKRQREHWQQLHEQQSQHLSVDSGPRQAGHGPVARQTDHVPAASTAQHAGNLYPPIPDWSQQQQQPAAQLDEQQRRRQQEEEDYRLALQLAAAFEEEDREVQGMTETQPAATARDNSSRGTSDEDQGWQEVTRTESIMQQEQQRRSGAQDAPAAAGGSSSSSRPSSQAAAAAGSGMGGLAGAGLAALLAMAAHAAAGSRAEPPAAATGSTAAAHSSGSSSSSSSSSGDAAARAASASDQSSSRSNQQPGFLRLAATALRNYLAGNNEAGSSSSSSATTINQGGAGSGGSSSATNRRPPRADEQPGPDDMIMLQQLMQAMMGVPAGAAAGGNRGRDHGQGSGPGFRVVRLPGGGFAASYSSSTGSGRSQQQDSDHAGPGFPMFADGDDPFGFMGGGTGDDFFSRLLLAGARSAHGNFRQQQQHDRGSGGFNHFDPSAGPQGRFESMEHEVLHPVMGLPGLIEALMGQGMFSGEGGGLGGFRYEDLVGLDPVHISTPEDVLTSLPKSTYVEGRQPGDSDTCVICQTAYTAGDELMHLPCLHAFHTDCITPWLQGHSKKCPVCKTDVC